MKPQAFVPRTVRLHDRQKPWAEWLPGTVLFADISGFTPMTEALSNIGPEGCEMLSSIMNRYFSEMIAIVHSHGGDIMKFGGDSMLCLFPGDTQEKALQAAHQMRIAIGKFQKLRTPVRIFALQMKIGIASGEVLVAGVGNQEDRCDYLFAGEPVDLASQAEKQASAGDVILAGNLKTASFETEKLGHFHRILLPREQDIAISGEEATEVATTNGTTNEIKPYLIREVYDMVSAGYDRYVGSLLRVTPVFVRFTGYSYAKDSFRLESFHEFFMAVVECAHRYGARLNGVSMGDKGSNFYFLFGAPAQIENKEKMACEWALETADIIQRNFPGVEFSVGMTAGRIFAGIVGGSGRYDYTVVGDAINTAARLTQMAGRNQVWVNGEIQEKAKESFLFNDLGSRSVKGKADSVPCFLLKERKQHILQVAQERECIGRVRESEEILHHLESAAREIPEMLVIEADGGVGKSFLAHHVMDTAQKNGWIVLSGKSEITRRSRAYMPWLDIFRSLLFHGEKPTPDEIREMLRETEEEFVRYESWHASFFQIEHPENIPEIDEETRKSMMHHQLSLVLMKRIKQPTLIFLDDLHWFDSLSLELLSSFLNHLRNVPLLLLAATRPEWQKGNFENRNNCYFMNLHEMDRETVSNLATKTLQGRPKDELIDFLYKHTRGNSFFTVQLLDYLRSSGLLVNRMGEWTLQREATVDRSFSGEEIIAAQLERLPMPEKIHLRAAACMGPTFSIQVLEKVLRKRFKKKAFQSLFSAGYLQRMEDGWATFFHALIQEVLYFSIPQKSRKDTHKRIGVAMERVFSQNIDEFSPNLANHFRLAGVRGKAIDYSISAGNRLYRSLSFPESRTFYQHAYGLLKNTSDSRKWEIGLKLARNLLLTGQIEECSRLSASIRRLTTRNHLGNLNHQAFILQSDARRKVSDYRYLPFCLSLLKDETKLARTHLCQLLHLAGVTYFRKGMADKAAHYLKRVMLWEGHDGDLENILSSHVILASLAAEERRWPDCFEIIESALALAGKTRNLYQELRIRIEWAGILLDHGKPEETRRILIDLLPRVESLGDFYLVAVILGSLGQCEIKLTDWNKGREYLHEAIRLFSTMGVQREQSKSEMWLGHVSFYQNDFRTAHRYYLNATNMLEKLGDKLETCYGYYNLAEVSLKLGNSGEASQWYSKGLNAIESQRSPELAGLYEELRTMIGEFQ